MKIRILLHLVIVIQVISQINGVSVVEKHPEKKIKFSPECRKIKCPSISEPLCVRLKYVTSAMESKTVYVVMINRCEMKYVTCHEGVEAKVLPMADCDHGKNLTSDLNALVEKRRKMDFKMLSSRKNDNVTQKKKEVGLESAMPKLIRHKRKAVSSKKTERVQASKEKDKVARKRKEMAHINDVKRQLFEDNPVTKNKKKQKKNLRKNINRSHLRKPYSVVDDDENQEQPSGDDGGERLQEGPKLHVYTKEHNEEQDKFYDSKNDLPNDDNDEQEDIHSAEEVPPRDDAEDKDESSSSSGFEYQILSEENKKLEQVDLNEYKADCPKMCPARGLMLCGRCKDGIYRTFLSACHMRMFDCGHPDEKLSLVARYPCAMSGPYLEDLRIPNGRIDEPHDEDVVLRFLKCKEYKNKKLKPYSKLNCTFDGRG